MKTRIISAIIMGLIAIPILFIGGLPFKILIILLSVASMYEILKARKSRSEIPLAIRIISYVLVATFVFLGNSVYSANYELIYKILIVIFLISNHCSRSFALGIFLYPIKSYKSLSLDFIHSLLIRSPTLKIL